MLCTYIPVQHVRTAVVRPGTAVAARVELDSILAAFFSLVIRLCFACASLVRRFFVPVSYTHLTLPTIYSV